VILQQRQSSLAAAQPASQRCHWHAVSLKTCMFKEVSLCKMAKCGQSVHCLRTAQALTDERRLRAFTQSEAASQPQPGGAFSMYGGSVQVRPPSNALLLSCCAPLHICVGTAGRRRQCAWHTLHMSPPQKGVGRHPAAVLAASSRQGQAARCIAAGQVRGGGRAQPAGAGMALQQLAGRHRFPGQHADMTGCECIWAERALT
jgi:hypothetical protein